MRLMRRFQRGLVPVRSGRMLSIMGVMALAVSGLWPWAGAAMEGDGSSAGPSSTRSGFVDFVPATRRPPEPLSSATDGQTADEQTADGQTLPDGQTLADDVDAAMGQTARLRKRGDGAPASEPDGTAASGPDAAAPPSLHQQPPVEPHLAWAPQLEPPDPAEDPVADIPLSRLLFSEDSAALNAEAEAELEEIAAQMEANEHRRIEIAAYASRGDASASEARRLSLSRALAVRAYLMEKGIASARMYVRALGDTVPDTPIDRVDVKAVGR